MYMLAPYMGLEKGTVTRDYYDGFIRDLKDILSKMEEFFKKHSDRRTFKDSV